MTPIVIIAAVAAALIAARRAYVRAERRGSVADFIHIEPVATLSCDAPSRGRFTASPAICRVDDDSSTHIEIVAR
ncbi:hypothetical protein [Sphingomonas sp.]|uniref:hypothetical protein n=1 Tax=Sphingomonas sp. TaxID=28214 RepID=UPI0035A93ED8